jgi:SAM-dependent methyltransferase
MTPRPSLCFDQVADRYDESRGGVERGVRMAADIVRWFAPGSVLEIGVGTGVVAVAVRDLGWRVHGVDLSSAMLRRALERLGPTVARANALALPVASAAVDNVLFVAALHAIGDVRGAVAEAARVLRPGGRVVAVHGVPRRESAQDDVIEALGQLMALRDARPDNPAELDEAAAAAGLEPAGTAWVAPVDFADSPNATADSIVNRLWSYLWDVDDEEWRDVVEPVVARLRGLPDTDRPRPYRISSRLVAYTRPAR